MFFLDSLALRIDLDKGGSFGEKAIEIGTRESREDGRLCLNGNCKRQAVIPN